MLLKGNLDRQFPKRTILTLVQRLTSHALLLTFVQSTSLHTDPLWKEDIFVSCRVHTPGGPPFLCFAHGVRVNALHQIRTWDFRPNQALNHYATNENFIFFLVVLFLSRCWEFCVTLASEDNGDKAFSPSTRTTA